MRRFAVAAVLVACMLGMASAAVPSLPRPKTGAPSCTQPIVRMTCFLDSTSGYVSGIRYGYADQTADTRVCAAATGSTVARGTTTVNETTNVIITNRADTIVSQVLWFNQTGQAGVTAVTNTRVMVERLEVLAFPGTRARGRVPAIRVYLWDSLTGDELGYVVCGNTRLEASDVLVPSAVYETPIEDGEEEQPRLLSSFTGRCARRNLINEPNAPTFFLQSIQKPCWVKVQPGNPATLVP